MDIYVKSLPAEAVLKDIPDRLNDGIQLELEENRIADDCSEFILKIPGPMGEGTIKAITFPAGFSLYQYDCTFNDEVRINFNISDIQLLKFIFCNAGCIDHSFEDCRDRMPINAYQNIIVAGKKRMAPTLF